MGRGSTPAIRSYGCKDDPPSPPLLGLRVGLGCIREAARLPVASANLPNCTSTTSSLLGFTLTHGNQPIYSSCQ